MARLDPRVPSSLECDWLEKRLDKVGRGNYLGAKTLDSKLVCQEGLQQSRNRELLMAASSGGVSSPREFARLRRLRASLAADKQVSARRRKQEQAGRAEARKAQNEQAVALSEEQQMLDAEEAKKAAADKAEGINEQLDNTRPEAGIGQVVRIRSNIDTPAYGWGNLESNAMGRVIQVQSIARAKEPDKREWHYLVEMLETPYHHAVTKPRFWVSQYEIEGRRGNAQEMTMEELAKLVPESQTDWERLDRLATPKSRASMGLEPNAFENPGATWSQSSGMGFGTHAGSTMGSTMGSMASSIGDGFAYPFVPMTSPRSRKLASGRREQLAQMAQANAEQQAATDSDAEADAESGEEPGASSARGGGSPRGTSKRSVPSIRPQTPYGELLYRSSANIVADAGLGVSTVESTASAATFEVRSPKGSKGAVRDAREPLAGPQLPQLPSCTPRLRRTCGIYGIFPRVPAAAASAAGKRKKKSVTPRLMTPRAGMRQVKPTPRKCGLHEVQPVPPMPLPDDAY